MQWAGDNHNNQMQILDQHHLHCNLLTSQRELWRQHSKTFPWRACAYLNLQILMFLKFVESGVECQRVGIFFLLAFWTTFCFCFDIFMVAHRQQILLYLCILALSSHPTLSAPFSKVPLWLVSSHILCQCKTTQNPTSAPFTLLYAGPSSVYS